MKEAKEMMIKLPMVTATSYAELNKARTYPQSGRYIVKLDNGDIVVADVTLCPIEQGAARSYDEEVQSSCTCFVGQPEILDPDEWMPAIDVENAKNAYEAEMTEQKEKYEAVCRETEENCKKLIEEKKAELQRHMDAFDSESEKNYQLRKMELEHEYEQKKLQLELDTPKRFAQCEWVSGKTLTEIIKTLAAGKKED